MNCTFPAEGESLKILRITEHLTLWFPGLRTIQSILEYVHVFRRTYCINLQGSPKSGMLTHMIRTRALPPSSGHHGSGASIFYRKLNNHLPHQLHDNPYDQMVMVCAVLTTVSRLHVVKFWKFWSKDVLPSGLTPHPLSSVFWLFPRPVNKVFFLFVLCSCGFSVLETWVSKFA